MGNEDLYKSALADYLCYCIANLNKESQKLKCVERINLEKERVDYD